MITSTNRQLWVYRTLAKAEDSSDNDYLKERKKGLLIYSFKKGMMSNKLNTILISLIETSYCSYRLNKVPLLSKLDMINCESLENNCKDEYKDIFNKYDILFIGNNVTIENNELIRKLQYLMKLKKITIIFLNDYGSDLAYQLNLLQETDQVKKLNHKLIVKKNILEQLNTTSKGSNLNYLIDKYFKNKDSEIIMLNIDNVYLKEEINELNDWFDFLKTRDNKYFALLVHKSYKVMLSHFNENNYTRKDSLTNDLFYYLIEYLLFHVKDNSEENVFKNKLYMSSKLNDIEIKSQQ